MCRCVTFRVIAGIAGLSIVTGYARAQPCEPVWSDQFSRGDFDSWIWDVVVHDDGSGPAVYTAGRFTSAGNTPVSYLASLEGTDWSAVGDVFNEQVFSLASCDDWPGLGPQLFAGGGFRQVGNLDVSSVARWDGTNWVALGEGVSTSGSPFSWVMSMLFVSDTFGQGPTLYAGGSFDTAGVAPALNIARWNGTNWSPLSGGLNGIVDTLAWFDDGSGPALYAGGTFTTGPDQFADVACWNGVEWTMMTTGFDLHTDTMVVHDDGSGPTVFVGGSVPDEDDSYTLGLVARWDGVAWTQVGGVFDSPISELGVFDVGDGPVLGASGSFDMVGSTEASGIAAWDGVSWSPLGSGVSTSAYGIVSIPGEAAMYAGGFLHSAGGIVVERFARWDGSTWSVVGNGVAGPNGYVSALEVYDDGSGPDLYVGGRFVSAGGVPAESLARWNGVHGTPVGGGIDGSVIAMEAVTDAAIGPGLYVGGQFESAGKTPALSIARWDGTEWSNLLGGVQGKVRSVRAMRIFDDGTGPALYVGGDFHFAGGVEAENIARWDGQQWSSVGVYPPNSTIWNQGLPGQSGVYALAVFDGALYAGGDFGHPVVTAPQGLARLDGDQWLPVGDGIDGSVRSMKVYDDGNGPALFIGGAYCILPDDDTTCRLASWNGSTWSHVPIPGSPTVVALEVYDDGTGFGPRLYAGGLLQSFADPALHHVAAWDGKTWTPLGSGVGEPYSSSSYVLGMAVFDDGFDDGDALYMGGVFETAGELRSNNLARWGNCGSFVLGDLTGDGVVGIQDFNDLLADWGPCPGCTACPADLDGDCMVGIGDLLILLAHWSQPF